MDTHSETPTSNPALAAQLAQDGKLSMQRLGSLQAFQERIAQRIAQAQTVQTQSLLSLSVQGLNVLIDMADINELLPVPEIMPVPLAKQWVKGLTVVRAQVLTVFDLAYCLQTMARSADGLLSGVGLGGVDQGDGWQATANTQTQQALLPVHEVSKQSNRKLVVLSKAAGQQLGFLADQVFGTVSVAQAGWTKIDRVYPQTPQNHIKHIWQNAQNAQDKRYLELSLPAMFASQAFINLAY